MHPYLEKIVKSGVMMTPEGEPRQINSHISIQEGLFLQEIINEVHPITSLEVGVAYGTSSMFICEAMTAQGGKKHISVDPGPVYLKGGRTLDRCGLGLLNLERCGYREFVEFYEAGSEFILPELLKKGEKIEFAFIDGWHTLDHCLVDFFYINRLLKEGGVVVFHDVRLPGIAKLMRYISGYPAYRLYKTPKRAKGHFSTKRKGIGKIISYFLFQFRSRLPYKPTSVAFQKIAEDARDWNWYKPF
jgi:predicted O-methyltransferase YrrM